MAKCASIKENSVYLISNKALNLEPREIKTYVFEVLFTYHENLGDFIFFDLEKRVFLLRMRPFAHLFSQFSFRICTVLQKSRMAIWDNTYTHAQTHGSLKSDSSTLLVWVTIENNRKTVIPNTKRTRRMLFLELINTGLSLNWLERERFQVLRLKRFWKRTRKFLPLFSGFFFHIIMYNEFK